MNSKIIDIRLVILWMLPLFMGSCLGDVESPDNPELERFKFEFHAREANYLWADNVRRIDENALLPNHSMSSKTILVGNRGVESIRSGEYLLGVTTCNVGLEDIYKVYPEYRQIYEGGSYNSITMAPHVWLSSRPGDGLEDGADSGIEKSLSVKLNSLLNNGRRGREVLVKRIDYRTSGLAEIKITSSQEFCGIPAGESLNNLFRVYHFSADLGLSCYVKANKELYSPVEYVTDIDKFVGLNLMVPPVLYFELKNTDYSSEGNRLDFRVEIELDNGGRISGETPSIILTRQDER